MEVFILDDGVKCNDENIGELIIDLDLTDEKFTRFSKESDIPSHGTICALIIRKYNPDCKIGSIKVLNSFTHSGNVESLVSGLEWCYQHHVRFIHMSIGSIQYKDFRRLKPILRKLWYDNCIIISACNNNNLFTIPACMSIIFGVKAMKMRQEKLYLCNQTYLDSNDFYAESDHIIIDSNGKNVTWRKANSFAAPYITCELVKMASENEYTYGMIKKIFFEEKCSVYPCYAFQCDFIQNALVIGSKHIKHREYLRFNIDGFYDYTELSDITVKRNSCFVIIPNQNLEFMVHLEKLIDKNNKYVKGVVWLGVMPKEIEDKCKEYGIVIWHTGVCEYWKQGIKSSIRTIDIPIIRIEGENESSFCITKQLESLFLKQEYVAICLTNSIENCLYEMEYIKEQILDEKVLSYYETYHNVDVLLCVGNQFANRFADIVIKTRARNIVCMAGTKVVCEIPSNVSNTIDFVFKSIINYFST